MKKIILLLFVLTPLSCKKKKEAKADNKEVIVNGYAFVDVVTVDELKHYAKDAGKSKDEIAKIKKPEVTYSFTSTGVYIKK